MMESAISFDANKTEQPVFQTVKETAWYFHLCEKQVRRLISRGDPRAYRFGTAPRIKKKTSMLCRDAENSSYNVS